MVDFNPNTEFKTLSRKLDGSKTQIYKQDGNFFVKNEDGSYEQVARTRKGNLFHKAQFSSMGAGLSVEKSGDNAKVNHELKNSAKDARQAEINQMHNKIRKSDVENKTTSQIVENYMRSCHRDESLKNGDVKYWSDIIDKISKEFNISSTDIIRIIIRESGFHSRNLNSGRYKGAMSISNSAAVRVFKDYKHNETLKQSNEKLYNDIFYKKDNQGNVVMGPDGNPVPKYANPKEFYEACANDEISIKLGMLLEGVKNQK